MPNNPIFVTKPTLAPLEEFTEILNGVWDRGILTHNGPLVQELEQEVCKKLNINHFVAVTNGTIAIQMAIKALGVKGEIITTPFTWVATLSAIQWEGCTPVFCDIEPDTLNIDPTQLEACITPNTVAIMPVHVFGNPCDVEAIDLIAKKYGLKVIYDAAHAIGSTYKGQSLLEYGNISATSLHATKLFNTAEGGACITKDLELFEKLKRIRFFGHDQKKAIVEEGFNGKVTEVHAALGLANLKYFDSVLKDRKAKYGIYKDALSGFEGISFQELKFGGANYSYFPIIFDSEEQLLNAEQLLNKEKVYPRRYFYPAVNTLEAIVTYKEMPIAEDIAKRILCLPLYYDLKEEEQEFIIQLLLKLKNS
ncbi:DegT/DnrJ/EryC1/StrS family aminotransferase [Mangrovimonas sp. CR14]|uniref:DegT/DnrJ/EryC1/StrS family aminotransferase n=1 Tax=Mangrovimonas sp. CR14 TaxID=2706120 RepID=UPI0014248C5C|nr:DegT/DnrJ/EryC1/StrS family aminotransferase [Mangrovimonas sp. CR14]NIK91376.1 DegT/DnrJ/EryC1/StrS family aminotransferase [Mangrovimonas sp. CR14]